MGQTNPAIYSIRIENFIAYLLVQQVRWFGLPTPRKFFRAYYSSKWGDLDHTWEVFHSILFKVLYSPASRVIWFTPGSFSKHTIQVIQSPVSGVIWLKKLDSFHRIPRYLPNSYLLQSTTSGVIYLNPRKLSFNSFCIIGVTYLPLFSGKMRIEWN